MPSSNGICLEPGGHEPFVYLGQSGLPERRDELLTCLK